MGEVIRTPRYNLLEDNISCVAFHPRKLILATGNIKNTAKLWLLQADGTSADCVATLVGHTREVTSIAFDPTEKFLATGSDDNTAKLWLLQADGTSADCVATLVGHRDAISSIAFDPTTLLLATGSHDKTVKLWNISANGTVVVCIATLIEHISEIMSIAFNPTGEFLASCEFKNITKLWHISADKMKINCVANLSEPKNTIYSVAFHPTALILATGSNKTAKIYNISADRDIVVKCVATLEGHEGSVRSVAFHPTLPILVTGDNQTAKFWLLSSDGSVATCVATLMGNIINAIAFHPKAPFLATLNGQKINVWQLNDEGIAVNFIQPITININTNNSTKVFTISKDLLNIEDIENKSCPNYRKLYDEIMKLDLSAEFRFKFKGQLGYDVGGLTRSIFEKLLPVYTHKFFKSIKDNDEFIILKENLEGFVNETQQLLLLAKAAGAKIFLKIDSRLLDLLLSSNLKEYFSNNKKKSSDLKKNGSFNIKKNNFTMFYDFINTTISTTNFDELENNSTFLRINKNKNNVINLYKKEQKKELKNMLIKEIRMRRFLVECGFTSWDQVQNMYVFIQNFWDTENFSFELKFDIESFSKKLKIFKEIDYDNMIEIPLDKLVKSSENSMQFDFNNLNNKILTIYAEYSLFRPFLNYILGPQSTDENRRLFVEYVAGTIYYPGELYLVLSHQFATYHFKSETCFHKLVFYKSNPDSPQFQINNATKFIKNQLEPKKGNVNFGHV